MLRMLFCCLLTVVWAPLCCLIVILVRLLTLSDAKAYAVFRFWARSTFWLAGIRRELVDLDRVDTARPRVYVANHPTSLDPLIMMSVIPGQLAAVGKKELRRMPIIGWVMMASGWLFIDRQNLESARLSIDAAATKIRSGLSVLIFPEGRRTNTPTELQEFKKGPFHLALAAGVPIQPARIVGWERHLSPGGRIPRPGQIEVRFGQEIVLSADESVESLRQKTRAGMEQLLEDDHTG